MKTIPIYKTNKKSYIRISENNDKKYCILGFDLLTLSYKVVTIDKNNKVDLKRIPFNKHVLEIKNK